MKAPAAHWLGPDARLQAGVIAVGLGGNVGGPAAVRARFEAAIAQLSQAWGQALVSPYLLSAPLGAVRDQPDFVNAVAAFRPAAPPDPHRVLATLLELELSHGRIRAQRGGPRTLDLDLLLVGQEVHQSCDLVLPHPRMGERSFVLLPLQFLFGDELRIDVTCLRVCERLAAGDLEEQRTRLL